MCFFGKQKHVAAIACLKKALYLDSFEWIISYNLGLVYLNTRQYASAFHFLSSSINLKPDFPSSYMYLAIILSRLDDFENACNAYEKAIEMEQDYLFHLVRIVPQTRIFHCRSRLTAARIGGCWCTPRRTTPSPFCDTDRSRGPKQSSKASRNCTPRSTKRPSKPTKMW
jgi:tetratricopeptide (TPR) repeat protein